MTKLLPEDKNNRAGETRGHLQGDAPTLIQTAQQKNFIGDNGISLQVSWDRDKRGITSATLFPILLCGFISELLYLVIVALAPLPGLHLGSTPLAAVWPWTLALSHLLFPGAWLSASTSTSPAYDWTDLVLLSVTLVAVMGVYALAVWSSLRLRDKGNASRRWLLLLLIGSIVFGITLLFQPALFSNDVFNSIFSGRILSIYHADPFKSAPVQFPFDPYVHWLSSGPYTPNIYGPLWLSIASLLVSIGSGSVTTLLLFKGVALLFHLLNCILVWTILGKLAPTRRLTGTLLYAWNPLALIELAGSGHNDSVLLSILLLATLFYVCWKGRWREIGILVLLGLAITMNLIALLIAPLFVWYLVRKEHNLPRAWWGFCWRMLLALGVVIPIYLLFWHGASTFLAITATLDTHYSIHAPMGLLAGPLRQLFVFVAQSSHFPPIMQPTAAADATLWASAAFIFALIYLGLFSKVRRATTTLAGMRYGPGADQEMSVPGFDILLDSWSSAIFWYLVLMAGEFWPWYILWALWVVVLRRVDARTITLLLLAATALLTYPLLGLAEVPVATYQQLLIFGIPLVYLLIKGVQGANPPCQVRGGIPQ